MPRGMGAVGGGGGPEDWYVWRRASLAPTGLREEPSPRGPRTDVGTLHVPQVLRPAADHARSVCGNVGDDGNLQLRDDEPGPLRLPSRAKRHPLLLDPLTSAFPHKL